MNKLKRIAMLLVLSNAINLSAQIAPTTGEKVLEIKESHQGEYLQTVIQQGISDAVIRAITERIPKKLAKYGFTDITITEVGKVPVPEGWATKMGQITSNKSVGQSMLGQAKTYNEMVIAVNKMYQPEDNDGVDWKFQVNIMDNVTKEIFKIRINMMSYNPQYIIKQSDLIKNITQN